MNIRNSKIDIKKILLEHQSELCPRYPGVHDKELDRFNLFCDYIQKEVDESIFTTESICEISKKIVNNQYFKDGNHRVAVYVYYYFHVKLLNMHPKMAVDEVYAALDHEIFKKMNDHLIEDQINTSSYSKAQTFVKRNELLFRTNKSGYYSLSDLNSQFDNLVFDVSEAFLDKILDEVDDLKTTLKNNVETINNFLGNEEEINLKHLAASRFLLFGGYRFSCAQGQDLSINDCNYLGVSQFLGENLDQFNSCSYLMHVVHCLNTFEKDNTENNNNQDEEVGRIYLNMMRGYNENAPQF